MAINRARASGRAPAKGHHAGERQGVHRHHGEQVRKGRRVLVRVGRIGVEKPAAVGAELLDRLLASHRSQSDALLGALQGDHVGVLRQGLRRPERGERKRQEEADGQQHIESDADQIGPEISDAFTPVGREGSRQSGHHHDASGRGEKVVDRQAGHLRQVGDAGFAGVELPVGVGDEADRRVERQVRVHALNVKRIEGEDALQAQERVK
jgi:hypothetical protein